MVSPDFTFADYIGITNATENMNKKVISNYFDSVTAIRRFSVRMRGEVQQW